MLPLGVLFVLPALLQLAASILRRFGGVSKTTIQFNWIAI